MKLVGIVLTSAFLFLCIWKKNHNLIVHNALKFTEKIKFLAGILEDMNWVHSEYIYWLLCLMVLFLKFLSNSFICGRYGFCVLWITNPLRAKIFHRKHKKLFTNYIIPPHWHDTGSWNPSPCKTRTCQFYIVNIMVADVLATQGARASATMILTMLSQINSVPAHLGSMFCIDCYAWGFNS